MRACTHVPLHYFILFDFLGHNYFEVHLSHCVLRAHSFLLQSNISLYGYTTTYLFSFQGTFRLTPNLDNRSNVSINTDMQAE